MKEEMNCASALLVLTLSMAFGGLGVDANITIGTCLVSPTAAAYVLPFEVTYGGSYGMCKPGWYCPNSDISNSSTWPAICPPTDDCLTQRLARKFCEPQGLYEPTPCPGGWYCPNSSVKIRCPAGYTCILGSVAPQKCGPFSICREGSSNAYDLSGIFAAAIVDAVVAIACFAYYRYRHHRESKLEPLLPPPSTPSNDNESSAADQRLYEMFRQAQGGEQPLTFECRNVSVAIPSERKEEPDKVLLYGATGSFRPGRVTAVMGPSGAGKTVFLTAVLGKLDPKWRVAGELTVNRRLTAPQVRSVIGVVPQDDVLHTELTVEENLYFSNETRLPASWTAEQRKELREAITAALGLSDVRHVRVGDESSKGISGGQRKRCSIGLELAAAPSALFLDEPTTGLDASTALDVCNLLKRLAQGAQLTVGMIIHQPRVEIWNALDEVLILAPGGRTAFQGRQEEAQPYFERTLGLDFSYGNPADIILDGVAQYAENAVEQWKQRLEREMEEEGGVALPHGAPPIPTSNGFTAPEFSSGVAPHRDGASFVRQVVLAHNRSLMKQYARPLTLVLDVFLGMVASTLMGSAAIHGVYIGLVRDEYVLIGPKQKVFLIPMLTMFYHLSIASSAAAAGIRTFGSEQQQYWREASAGHNRLAYFVGYTIAGVYRLVLSSLHFSLIAYVMWEPIQSFGSFFLVLFLTFLCVDSQSALLSMVLRPDEAPLLATVIAVFMALLNGYPNVPFIDKISYAWWSTEAILEKNLAPVANVYKNQIVEDGWGYKLGEYDLDIGILVLIFVLYRIIAFALMLLTNREKQR